MTHQDRATRTPLVSVVMPIYNVQRFVADAIRSVLSQSFDDFELVIVDDCATDRSLEICRGFDDRRIRIVSHERNRGLAGARNTGIRLARGEYVALLDSDDRWDEHKLREHVAHLQSSPDVGVSFSRSTFIDEHGRFLSTYQMPRLTGIDLDHLMCRNPVGNGSAPVIRLRVLEEIAVHDDRFGVTEAHYFDDQFRQSEDIECWIRIAATTRWHFEGLSAPLTHYRLNPASLSADIPRQLASWQAVMTKVREFAPQAHARVGRLAFAYQLRYLARQAVRQRNGSLASSLVLRAIATAPSMLLREPGRSAVTALAALLLLVVPAPLYARLEPWGLSLISRSQRARIALREQGAT